MDYRSTFYRRLVQAGWGGKISQGKATKAAARLKWFQSHRDWTAGDCVTRSFKVMYPVEKGGELGHNELVGGFRLEVKFMVWGCYIRG